MTTRILIVVLALAFVGCEKKDAAASAVASFEKFIADTYPATTVDGYYCTLGKPEVRKTDSATSPFKGTLSGKAGAPKSAGATMGAQFNLVFWQTSEGSWECQDEESSGTFESFGDVQHTPDPCGLPDEFCQGKKWGK